MIDLMTHLFRLRAVVEEGSLRRAAARLGITQPALSRSVQQIEERFGEPLLMRHSRGVLPTPLGERVLSSVLRLSRQWEIAEQELLSGPKGQKADLRIEAGPIWRLVVLPRILQPLLAAYPDVTVHLDDYGVGVGYQRLVEGRIDAIFGGLQFAHDLPPRLVPRAFTQFRDRVIARETHPLLARAATGGPIPLKSLLDYPWLVYTGDPIYELEIVHAAAERLGRAPDIRVRCESLTSAIGILQHSDCISILPDAALAGATDPKVVPLPVSVGRRSARSGAVYREELAEWGPFARLLDLCAAYFGADDHPATRSKALP